MLQKGMETGEYTARSIVEAYLKRIDEIDRKGAAINSVPARYIQGVPMGISFMAGAWSEPTLIKLAYADEQATRHRRTPRFLPTDLLGN